MKLDIVRYGSNGEGIAVNKNKVIFVPYTIQGETVDCEILKDNKTFAIAKLNNIINKSENRTDVICPYFYDCGGCNLLHMNNFEQQNVKKQIVKNNLKKYANVDYEINDIFCAENQFFYRNHITFAVSEKGELGFFRESTKDVLNVKKCFLVDEKINSCVSIFNEYFFDNQIKGFNYHTKEGNIKQIDIKYLSGQMLITIVGKNPNLPNLKHLIIRLNCLHTNYGIYFSKNVIDSTIYGELTHLYGIKQIEHIDNGLTSYVSPFSFLQVNSSVKEKIYEDINSYICENETVVDAYSGRGELSAIMSKKAKKVIAIEIMKSSVIDADILLKNNNINNVSLVNGDCKVELAKIETKVDTIVLDPPRKGADKSVVMQVIKMSPNKIIYMSCSSNTLARDLKDMLSCYEIKSIKLYDMFPNTKHIETLAILEKKNG